MERFGSWLLKELDQCDLSQADLARACKITTAQISRIVSGERNAGARTLAEIAQVLKLPIEFVFEKAGLLPPKPELLPIHRKILFFASQLPESDLKIILAILERFKPRKK